MFSIVRGYIRWADKILPYFSNANRTEKLRHSLVFKQGNVRLSYFPPGAPNKKRYRGKREGDYVRVDQFEPLVSVNQIYGSIFVKRGASFDLFKVSDLPQQNTNEKKNAYLGFLQSPERKVTSGPEVLEPQERNPNTSKLSSSSTSYR